MKCEDCHLLIERYFDGELDGPEADFVTGHLAVCGPCAQTNQMLEREQDFYLRHESDVDVSPAFWSNVFATAPEDQSAPTVWFPRSLLDRIANSLAGFGSPRFTPVSTMVIALVAIVATVGVMK